MAAFAAVSKSKSLRSTPSTDARMHHRRPYQLSSPTAPVPRPLPAGFDPVALLARQTAMIDAGTHPTLAERLALSATENQAMRDRDPRFAARAGDAVR